MRALLITGLTIVMAGLGGCAGFSGALPEPPPAQGKLDKIREESGRKPKGTRRTPKSRSRSGGARVRVDEGLDWTTTAILGRGFLIICASPFSVPAMVLDDSYEYRGGFLPHPYHDSQPGSMVIDDEDGRDLAVQLRVENGYDFDDDIYRFNLHATVDTSWRIGVMANYTYLRERLDDDYHDDTNLGDVTAFFRFAQNELAQFRFGIGYRFLSDNSTYRGGVNTYYGFDFYPVQPLSISGSIELGNLGVSTVVHSRLQVGVDWKEMELYAGYDNLRVGSVCIHGPMAGLRLYF